MFISKKEAFSAKIQIQKHRWLKPLSCAYNLYAYGTKEIFPQSRQVSSYSLKKDQYLPYQSKNQKVNLNLRSYSTDFQNQPGQPPNVYCALRANSSGDGYAPKPLDLKIIRNLLFGFNLTPIQTELSKNVSINSYVKSKSISTHYQSTVGAFKGALTKTNKIWSNSTDSFVMTLPSKTYSFKTQKAINVVDSYFNIIYAQSADVYPSANNQNKLSGKAGYAHSLKGPYESGSRQHPSATSKVIAYSGLRPQQKSVVTKGHSHTRTGSKTFLSYWLLPLIGLVALIGQSPIPRSAHSLEESRKAVAYDHKQSSDLASLQLYNLDTYGLKENFKKQLKSDISTWTEQKRRPGLLPFFGDQKETSFNQLYKVVAFGSAPEQLLQDISKQYSVSQQNWLKKDKPIIGHFVTQKLNNFCFDTISAMPAAKLKLINPELALKPSNSIYTASNFALKTTYSNLLFKKLSLLSNNSTLSHNSSPLVAYSHKQKMGLMGLMGLNHKRADLAFAERGAHKEIKYFPTKSYKDVLAFLNNLIYGLNWNTLYPALYTNNVGAKICFEASMAHKCAYKRSLHKPTGIIKNNSGHAKNHSWLRHIEASYNLLDNASRTLHSTNNLLEFDSFIYGPEAYLHNNQKNLYPALNILKLFQNYLSQESFSLPLVGAKGNNNNTVSNTNYLSGLSVQNVRSLKPCFNSSYNMLLLTKNGLEASPDQKIKPSIKPSVLLSAESSLNFQASPTNAPAASKTTTYGWELKSAYDAKASTGFDNTIMELAGKEKKLNKQKSKKPLFKKGFIKMHSPILTTSQQRLGSAPQASRFSNVSVGVAAELKFSAHNKIITKNLITKNFGVALSQIGSDTINHVNPPLNPTLLVIGHNTNNQNNALVGVAPKLKLSADNDAKLGLEFVSKNVLLESPKQSNSNQTNISRIFSKYIRYIRNKLNNFLKLNKYFNKEVLYNYLPKNSNFQLAGGVVKHSTHQENLTLPPHLRISNINNKIYRWPEEPVTSITGSKTIFQNVMPIVLQQKKFLILSSKARPMTLEACAPRLVLNSDNAKAESYATPLKAPEVLLKSTFKVSDVTDTFQELNKYKKDMQKKRKAKKQRLEGRRKKKRKRFYPRPTWLRLRLGVSLYKTKTSQQSLGAVLQASTRMAKYKGLSLNQPQGQKHGAHIVKNMAKVWSKNHFYKYALRAIPDKFYKSISNNQNTSGYMSKNNLKNSNPVGVAALNFLNNYIQTLSKPYATSATVKTAHLFMPVNLQVGTQQVDLTSGRSANYQMAVNNTAYNNIVYNLWLASRKANNGFSRAQLAYFKNLGRSHSLAEGYKKKPNRVGSAEAIYSYKKKVLINNMLGAENLNSLSTRAKTSSAYFVGFVSAVGANKADKIKPKQFLINFKNTASYANFEEKSNSNVPKKEINKNTLRDFWIWLYNLTSTNEISAALNKQIYIKNLLNYFSIPIFSGKNLKTLQTNNINPQLEYVGTTKEPETLSIKKQSVSAEHIRNLDANTRNSISIVGDSKAFSQKSFEAFKDTLNTPYSHGQDLSTSAPSLASEYNSLQAPRLSNSFSATFNTPISSRAAATNKKTLNRVKWSLNRTNLWSSTNQRISFWATQKLRNQSKNNKTKYIEKQFKKQMNYLFANLQAKAFFSASDKNLNHNYQQNFKGALDKIQSENFNASKLAKNYKLSISQKMHQKQIKLSYITSGPKQNSIGSIGYARSAYSINRYALGAIDQNLLVNTSGTSTAPNLLLSTVGARLTLALQNGGHGPLESANKLGLTGFITKPSSVAWFENSVFDIPSKLSNQFFNNWNSDLWPAFNMPPLNANGFGGADSKNIWKNIWPVALCSLLLHFSALISLISISQIRCFIKFHFILLYKLANIYLQIIYQNQKLITNFCSGLFFGQKNNLSTYGSGLKATLRPEQKSYTVQPSMNSVRGRNLGVSKKPSRVAAELSAPIIMLQQSAKQNTNVASPNKDPDLQLYVKNWLGAERGGFGLLYTKKLTKIARSARKKLNNLYSRASSINNPLSTIKRVAPSSADFRLAKLDNSIKKIKTSSRNYNPNYSIFARFGVSLLPNQTLKASARDKLKPTQQLYIDKKSQQKDLFYYKQSIYKLSNFFITFLCATRLYFRKKPKSYAAKQNDSGYSDKQVIYAESLATRPSTKNQTKVLLAEYVLYKNVFQQKINKISLALNYEGIGSIKKGSYETSLKIVDTFEYFLRIIYGFFEKPAELTMDWIAYAFLVEWSSDLLTFTPENKDKQNWLAFSKLARQNRPLLPIVWYSGVFSNPTAISANNYANALSSVISSGSQSVQILSTSVMAVGHMASTLIFSQFLYKRILYLNDVFIEIFNRPDTDLINRQKKGTLFWDIWSDILIKAADQYNINVPSLSNIKEEQNLLIDKFLAESPTTFVGSKNTSKQIKTGLRTSNLYALCAIRKDYNTSGAYQKNLFGLSNSALELESASFSQIQRSSQSQTILTSFLTQPAIVKNKAKAPFITEFITYQSKETDLFLDYHPPKSFNHLSSIQYYSLVQQPIGTLVCQIYAGILNKQISKNILVIGSTLNSKTYTNFERMQKTLLIQALAGETEIKIITDNANRYAIVNRGFAVGIKLLKDVFEALALNTPCLFLLEDIHLIGERRPLLISDHGDSLGDEMSKSTEIAFGAQRNGDAVHEKNQILYQYNRHGITHYQKPFKGDFSLSIPTNHFSFDLFFKTRSSNFNYAWSATPTNPLVYGINFEDLASEGKNKSNQQDSSEKNLSSTGVQKLTSQRTVGALKNKNYASSLQLKAAMSNNQLLSPPSTSPFTVLLLKEQKKLKPKKIVKELPWVGLPSEQLAILPRVSYSVRAKVAALADLSFSNMSAKFDMITDLLVIIDSVRGNRGFVVFATTHLPHILDPALRRPGRLDETISIPTLSNIWNRWEFTKGPQPDILYTTYGAKEAGYMAKSNPKIAPRNLTVSNFQNIISASAKLVPSGNNLIGYQGTLDYLDFLNLDMLGSAVPNQKTNFLSPIISTLQAMRINKKDSRYHTKTYIKAEHLATCNSYGRKSDTLSQKATSKRSLHKNSNLILSSVAYKAKGYRQENKTSSETNIAYYQMGRSLIRNWVYTKALSTSGLDKALIGVGNFASGATASRPLDIKNRKCFEPSSNMAKAINIINIKSEGKMAGNMCFGFSQNANQNQRLLWNILNFSPIYHNNALCANTTNSSTLLTETREFLSTEVQYKSIYSSTHVIKNTLIALISGKFSELFAFKTLPMLGLYGKTVLVLQQPINGSKHSGLLKATLKQKNPVTLYGIDQTWRAAMSLALSFVQKRYLYHKNLIVPKLLNFLDSTPLEEAPSPPSSNILIPAKRYENYKKVLKENLELNLYSNTGFGPPGQFLFNKVEKHLKQSFIQSTYGAKSIYKKASQESFSDNLSLTAGHKQSNMAKTAQLKSLSSMDTATQFVAAAHQTTNIYWYYENKLLKRHKNSLTNQWWTGQLIEHNAETLFLSDIDWRYTFYYQRSLNQSNKKTTQLNVNNKSNIQDILLDFPDSDQHYNPKQRRWLLNSGYWSSWFDFDRTLQTEILNHFIFECFVTSYNILNKNRELLDYSVTKYLQKGLIKEINMIGLISRLVN